jgi:translocation and assembly module TamB
MKANSEKLEATKFKLTVTASVDELERAKQTAVARLGKDVKLAGFGLDASVDGRLTVHETPGEATSGSGQIRVSGIYKAYGQDLTIRQGQLLYAGTPLDNPQLNIVATRTTGEISAGLRIRGTAQSPELDVFSDPAMDQANALSYLVAGKPVDDLGSAEGEGDAVQAAARSLGTAAGGLLAKGIGRRLGVDEVGVEDSEMIGGAALTVGQYLSPRVYLSYGIGLFEPGEVVTLRYKLSDELAVQAQRGSQDTRAGIEYRIEK